MDPAQLNNRQLIAAQYTPQQMIGMDAAEREAIAGDHPANLTATPSSVAIPLPGGGSVPIPLPELPGLPDLPGVVEAAADPVGTVTDKITSAVLGPVAEVVFGMVISSAGVALIVWALVALGRRTGATEAVKSGAETAAKVAVVAA